MEQTSNPLLDLLSINLVLRQTAPYLPISSLLALSRVNRAFQALIHTHPEAWRHLDLSRAKSATIDMSPIDAGGISWRAERMDEALTEDDFYSGPLRGIFSRLHTKGVLQWIHTLILDGLSVPADLVREIIAEDRFSVRILSLRDCKHLNHTKLQQVLRYAVRPGRPDDSPKLRGLYVFGHKDNPRTLVMRDEPSTRPSHGPPTGVLATEGAQIGAEWNSRSSAILDQSLPDSDQQRWYSRTGRTLIRPTNEWAGTLYACQDIIAFDAVLCKGPRHDIAQTSSRDYLPPRMASIALGPSGCETCGRSPEGPAIFRHSHEDALPLLAPPPTHSSTVRASQRPDPDPETAKFPPLFTRCEDCLRGRWCERCNRWWCEACYAEPISRTAQPSIPQIPTSSSFTTPTPQIQSVEWGGPGPAPSGPATAGGGAPVKVYSKLCVEHCLVGEMMMSADGFWG